MKRGNYIVIEGSDGTGKSTQVGLLRERLAQQGIASIEFHEPEGTPIANEIRTIIKNGTLPRDPVTNLLLFTAARHEIWQNARKKLEAGTWVVASRNYYSTLAYQGYGEGLNLELIEHTTRQFTDEAYMNPDLAVILSLNDNAERKRRLAVRGVPKNPDTFESKDDAFLQRINDGYLAISREYSLPVLSASRPTEEITSRIHSLVQERILHSTK